MSEDEVRGSLADLCASYQAAVVDALASRASEALARGSYRSLGLSGGVANNGSLRTAIEARARAAGARFLPAEPRHTGDNAAMIGFAAWIDAADAGRFTGSRLRVDPAAYL
jgi:N6-L-threonylcarbamoyladenine synthase